MKVYHILEDYSLQSGGIRTVVKDLKEHVSINSEIITTNKELIDKNVKYFETNNKWQYSKELKCYLNEVVKEPKKVFHIHGVWMFPQFLASKLAILNRSPFLLTPHGMFEPWLWKQGYVKKLFYYKLLSKQKFNKANIIHAITHDEKINLHKIFNNKVNIEVIPNLISTQIIPNLEDFFSEEKYILFLGRIHPKKGIKLLIKVFSRIKQTQFKLKIAGPDSHHKQELVRLVNKLNLDDKVHFVGMVKGKEKFKLYKGAHVFVAPSYSEVIGMVNLEAAIMGTPVITTFQTGLLKEWNNEGGFLIQPNENELEQALTKSFSWSELERKDRGNRLKEFVLTNYSWERNKHKWEELYNSLIH